MRGAPVPSVSAQDTSIRLAFTLEMRLTGSAALAAQNMSPEERSQNSRPSSLREEFRLEERGDSLSSKHSPGTELQNVSRAGKMWMLKSSLRSFFELKTLNGRKEARCLYCDKRYSEGESTGNMAKHVRALHPAAWETKDSNVLKVLPRDVALERLEPLRVSQWIADERRRNLGEVETAMLAVEQFLPASFVQSASWARWSDRCSPRSNIKSSTTLIKKLGTYQKHMNKSLQMNVRDSQFANIQLGIWTSDTGESFLGVMVSFAPNLWNKKMLEQAKTFKILLNNCGQAQSTHLVDLVNLGAENYTRKHLRDALILVLERYELKDKTATITVANNSCNESLFTALVYSVFGSSKPFAHRMFGKTRKIYCMIDLLNSQAERAINLLFCYPVFFDACDRINNFAKAARLTSHGSTCLEIPEIAFVPENSQFRWSSVWSQLNTFIRNYFQYEAWHVQMIENGQELQEELASRLRSCVNLESRAIELLEYFVKTFAIFYDLVTKLQQDGFDHLANGVPASYLLESFHRMCVKASNGARVTKSRAGYDFSCLNGSASLKLEDKEIVLDALRLAGCTHQEFMSHVRNNPLYYVAVILDPSAKIDTIYTMMSSEEASERVFEAKIFLDGYFKKYRENSLSQGQPLPDENSNHSSSNIYFDRRCLSTTRNEQESGGDPNEEKARSLGCVDEWSKYQEEPLHPAKSREGAIAWWYERRQKYPMLFELAVSLLYTRLSACSIEQCFQLAAKVMRDDRKRLKYNNFKTLMVLRDRFTNFGFFDGQPSDPVFSDGDSDDLLAAEDVALDDQNLPESGDDT
ncbi:putative transposase of the Rover hAT-like DNA transposon [Lachancea quebecensis]|uniref:Putative transposase of the Rover hAT-like DNA transposon n=1 Tax=Lachancea quebecensis TaxID=1654605 RepID=A0A0P1KV77_9SACH|nr:putative transposase of the Rover hAT-like DNA transposon [Lachancea quebecensis]